ncbi:MAG: stage III sporulation protein AF [Bacillota bacterium]|nr:stage III sporulation protein AF [Bacillota bacterium]MDP4169127.1 stage III sporulation protein AF [Bacillota bacterium]
MNYLIEWITNIILFILLATVIDMLLPNSSMQKYIKMVVGLILIAIILTPVLKLISYNFEDAISSMNVLNDPAEKNMKNLIESKKKEIQASQHAYILEQMAVQLKKGAEEELMNRFGMEIANINILTDDNPNHTFPDNLQKVSVTLKHPDNQIQTVEAVKQIEINASAPLKSKKNAGKESKIASLLAKEWNVADKVIEVSIEGGETQKDE